MSVKQMTTEQIQDDLDTIAITWPDGTPPEQDDRVKALKGELKRRGETITARPPTRRVVPRPDVNDMTREALEKELRELSATLSRDPQDAGAQDRFADIRFALRNRVDKAVNGDAQTKRSTSLPPRALELPDEDEVELRRRERETKDARAMKRAYQDPEGDTSTDDAVAMKPRRATSVVAATVAREIRRRRPAPTPAPPQAPTSVNGFTAAAAVGADNRVGVDFEYERRTSTGVVCVARHFRSDEWDAFVAMAMAVRDQVEQANLSASDDDQD